MTKHEFERMTRACTTKLKNYCREASRTCEMLSECTPGPPGIATRATIHDQRLRENEAFLAFQKVRLEIFGLLPTGYEE